MNNNYKIDLSDSAYDFDRLIVPMIKGLKYLKGEIIPVETSTKIYLAKKLDTHAGIDSWSLIEDKGMRGIASRVQYGNNWKTFNMRIERNTGTKTEFKKRKEAIDNDYLYPYYMIHGYCTLPKRQGEVISFAITKTKTFIDICQKEKKLMNNIINLKPFENKYYGIRKNPNDNNKFVYISWDYFLNNNCPIKHFIMNDF